MPRSLEIYFKFVNLIMLVKKYGFKGNNLILILHDYDKKKWAHK